MIPISQQAPLTFADNTLFYHDLPLLREIAASPIAFIGRGDADVAMYQGNFEISDNMQAKLPLTLSNHVINENEIILTLGFQGEAYLELTCFLDAGSTVPKTSATRWTAPTSTTPSSADTRLTNVPSNWDRLPKPSTITRKF